MSKQQDNSNIEQLLKEITDLIGDDIQIYDKDLTKLIEEVQAIHLLAPVRMISEAKLKEIEKKIKELNKLLNEKQTRAKKVGITVKDSNDNRCSMTPEQIKDILNGLGYGSVIEGDKANTREERYKVPSLRFAEIKEKDYLDMEGVIKKAENEINEGLPTNKRYTVKLVENIDMKASSPDKFYIMIEDSNGNYVTMDLLKYQENIYDYTVDEEESIKNVLVKLNGAYTQEIIEASRRIANYISLALSYKETFHREYKIVGWSKLDGNTIFKYDKIYSNNKTKYKGFCGEDWADALSPKKIDISESSELSEDKKIVMVLEPVKKWNKFMAETFNRSAVADIILCAAVSGIIRQSIVYTKETNINMNIVAEKGSGKTTMQHLVLSFFGDPDKLEGSFIDTDNIEAQTRVERSIIPYILDERLLKVESNGEKKKATEMLMSIFKEYEGRVKAKLGSQYNNSNASAYGAIISSSVESLLNTINNYYKEKDENGNETDLPRDLGQYRRFIEINAKRGDLFKDGNHAIKAEKISKELYGYGVSQLVTYMFELMKYEEHIKYLVDYKDDRGKGFSVETILSFIDTYIYNTDCSNLRIEQEEIFNKLDKCSVKVEGNNLSIFEDLFRICVEEIDLEVQEIIGKDKYLNSPIYKEMESSFQRFALLVFTGYLLNHSIGIVDDENKLQMDMDAVVHYLTINLYDKLFDSKIFKKEERVKRVEATKKEVEKQEKQKKLDEQKEYKELLFKLCDWLKTNKEYFYIPTGKNKNNRHTEDNLIGRYVENESVGKLEITIPGGSPSKVRLINWNVILNNLDLSGEDFLDIQYHGKEIPNIKDEYTFKALLENCEEIKIKEEYMLINGLRLRGDVIEINIRAIERAQKELQSQEESNNETN